MTEESTPYSAEESVASQARHKRAMAKLGIPLQPPPPKQKSLFPLVRKRKHERYLVVTGVAPRYSRMPVDDDDSCVLFLPCADGDSRTLHTMDNDGLPIRKPYHLYADRDGCRWMMRCPMSLTFTERESLKEDDGSYKSYLTKSS